MKSVFFRIHFQILKGGATKNRIKWNRIKWLELSLQNFCDPLLKSPENYLMGIFLIIYMRIKSSIDLFYF